MNLKTAQTNARNAAELGDLRARWNDAARQGWSERLEALSREYFALKEAGRTDEARAVRAQGLAMINERWGL